MEPPVSDPVTWQFVALQALNMVQTVLLAYLAIVNRTQAQHLDQLRSQKKRRDDPPAMRRSPV